MTTYRFAHGVIKVMKALGHPQATRLAHSVVGRQSMVSSTYDVLTLQVDAELHTLRSEQQVRYL